MLGDEAIWRRLREAGLDEETVKRRDKAALIAYISKLESEVELASSPLASIWLIVIITKFSSSHFFSLLLGFVVSLQLFLICRELLCGIIEEF